MPENTNTNTRIIRKIEEFIVNNLGKVAVLTAIDPQKAKQAQESEVIYQGFAVMGARMHDGRVMQVPTEFEIDASSLEEAFDKFQNKANENFRTRMEEASKAAEAQQIANGRRIITPNMIHGV